MDNTTALNTRDPFIPRPPKVRGRAIALAVLAHLLLVLALWFSVDWRSEEPATVAAELWSATPQIAAPRANEPTPTPPQPQPKPAEPVVKAAPTPKPVPVPTPKPPEPVVVKPPTPSLPDPQIAIEKAKREDAKRLAAQQEALKQKQREKEEQDERDQQALAAKKKEADRQKQEKAAQTEQADKAAKAEQAKQAKLDQAKADKAEAARLAAMRDAQMKRMAGLAGATGAATDTGTALRSSAPSANYGGRVAARVKPNIVFSDTVDGNPRAVVEVRLAADGTIVGKRLVESSGSKSWDDAVLRAIDRTGQLPLDNGRAPPVFEIGFRPKD